MTTTAFLAHSGIWNSDENVVAKLKLATLLNDTIIHSGQNDPTIFAHVAAEESGEPPLNEQTLRELSYCWRTTPVELPQFEILTSKSLDTFRKASGELKLSATESLLQYGLSPREHYEDFKLHMYTVLEIEYWRSFFPRSTFIGHGISDRALLSAAAPVIATEGLLEALAPASGVFDLSWNDIFDLRRSQFLATFRQKYTQLVESGQQHALKEHYQEALERLADEVRPSTEKAVGMAVLSNLPIPVVSTAIHLAHAAHDIHHQEHLRKHFGWVMFVREARQLHAKA